MDPADLKFGDIVEFGWGGIDILKAMVIVPPSLTPNLPVDFQSDEGTGIITALADTVVLGLVSAEGPFPYHQVGETATVLSSDCRVVR